MLKNKKFIISVFVILVIIVTAFIIISKLHKEDKTSTEQVNYEGLSVEDVRNTVTNKVNTGKIYIDDVEKVNSISFITLKETIDNIELWEMSIKYEKSSLSAPIGQSYAGKTFTGTYCYAYNKETKQSFKYMFPSDEYSTLKGWATQGHKEDSSYWINQ